MFNKKIVLELLFILSVVFSTVIFSFAQGSTTGSLQGIVKDSNNAVVAGASVKVTNTDTGISKETTTNQDGLYRVSNLIPGDKYQVDVTAAGFQVNSVKNISVRLGTDTPIDIQLAVQGANVDVTITGETPLINSQQNQLSTSYSPKQLQQLPYNGGSIDNLALLTPGIVTPGDTDFTNGVGISANGNRGRSNNFQLDGQDNNDNSVAGPSLSITNAEAVGDYQVTTNNPSAEFGRNSGAQINVTTKSGTNEFHGSFFEFLQNSSLNTSNNVDKQALSTYSFLARNGYSNIFNGLVARKGKDLFRANRFGGALGGPIVKNKAFFFFTYQGDIQTGEQTSNNFGSGGITFTPQSVALARTLGFPGATGILSNTNVGGGPVTANVPGRVFVLPALTDTNGDGVPDAFANPNGNAYYNSLFVCTVAVNPCPAANLVPLQTGEVLRIGRNDSRENQIITREDINLTDKDNLSFRYVYDTTHFPNTAATGTFISGAFFDVPSKNNNFGATYTRTISSRFTNEFRFNFSRLDVKFGDPTGTLPAPGISFNGQRDIAFGLDQFGDRNGNFTSLNFGTANNLPQSRKVDVYQEQDTFSATLGNHSVRTGFDIRQQKVANFFLPNFLGTYRFGSGGVIPGLGAVCARCNFYNEDGSLRSDENADTVTAFENLLYARPNRINFALGDPNIKTKQNDYFFFVQDDYRVTSNLTLNLGLRYEFSTSPFNPIIDNINAREADSARAIFNQSFPLSTRTANKLPNDKNNFAPRVGFAYSPNFDFLGGRFKDGKTVIRGGFGISYDPSFFNIVLNTVTAAPYAASGTVSGTGGTIPNFPFLPNTTAQLNTTPNTNGGDPRLFNQTRVDPNLYNPYTMNFNLGIQQEIFKDTVIEVRYVGTRIIGQFQTVNGNPDLRILNRAAQCVGLAPGAFTNGIIVGTQATSQSSACRGQGFNSRTGTNGNGRIDPNFGITRLRTNGASGSYHGLQTRFDTRFSNIVFNANYTFSKTIDNASEIFSTFGGGQTVADPENPFNSTSQERGLSAFDQRHNFTANFIYEVPFYKDQKGIVGKLLGGYQFAGIIRLGSGRPYTPTNLFGNSDVGFDGAFFSGVGSLRPYQGNANAPVGTIAFGYTSACVVLFADPTCNTAAAVPGTFILYNTLNPGSVGRVITAQQALQQARLIYNDTGIAAATGLSSIISSSCATGLFNPATQAGCAEAFSLFKTPFGIGRNTFHGGASHIVNLSLFKTTTISERFKIEFRAEASNLLNSRNFGVPDPITEDAFGSTAVSSFQNPGFNGGARRELRFGLRFLF